MYLLLALTGLAVGVQLASAGENDPGGRKSDTRYYGPRGWEVYILRGTEPKNDTGVTVTTKEPPAKVEPPKTRIIRHGRHRRTVPAE